MLHDASARSSAAALDVRGVGDLAAVRLLPNALYDVGEVDLRIFFRIQR